jgi:truncated hemoglobin YjbI
MSNTEGKGKTDRRTTEYLQAHLSGMIKLIEEKGSPDLRWRLGQLEAYQEKLHAVSRGGSQQNLRELENDFYLFLETDDRLKSAFFVVYYNEIKKPCLKRLEYFNKISKERPLKLQERTELRCLREATAQIEKDQRQEMRCFEEW